MSTTPVQWQQLRLEDFAPMQLYEVLKLRSAVFVVEQNCVFPDMDGLDPQAMHLVGTQTMEQGRFVVAYARLFPAGIAFPEASVGRVVTDPRARGTGIGHELIDRAIAAVHATWGVQPIRIGAQAQLKTFYAKHGFVDQNKPYVEDGIDHLEMLLTP